MVWGRRSAFINRGLVPRTSLPQSSPSQRRPQGRAQAHAAACARAPRASVYVWCPSPSRRYRRRSSRSRRRVIIHFFRCLLPRRRRRQRREPGCYSQPARAGAVGTGAAPQLESESEPESEPESESESLSPSEKRPAFAFGSNGSIVSPPSFPKSRATLSSSGRRINGSVLRAARAVC